MLNIKLKYQLLIISLFGLSALLFSSIITVDERKNALVLQFGNVKRVIYEPGINFIIPFIQNVEYFDKRVLSLDPKYERIILADKKRLLVDSIARYKIINPLQFYKSVGSEDTALRRLGAILNSSIRDILGSYTLESMLTDDRDIILDKINEKVRQNTSKMGIEILDVRIRKADLPQETSQSVYERMKAERIREAKEFRAEGFKESKNIKTKADREVNRILSEAKKKAASIKAAADTKRYDILRSAMSGNNEFAKLYIALQSYKDSIDNKNTSLVLNTDMEYFKYFKAIK